MNTTRTALDLLARATSIGGVADVVGSLGFGPAVALSSAAAQGFGLGDLFATITVARRASALRALVVQLRERESVRIQLQHAASRLARSAPQFAWLIAAVGADGTEAALSAWEAHGVGSRHTALVWEPARVRPSDAETLGALIAASVGDDALVYHRWHEILGRQLLSARFYRTLERAVIALANGAQGEAPAGARREIALVNASRLLFLSFLQSRGWLDNDADFLVQRVDATLARGGGVHRRLLEPLFFGTLNAPLATRAPAARSLGRLPFLNGGLFSRAPLEQRYRALRFRDEDLSTFVDDVLTKFRFSPREERPEWSEAAVDPEILGRAFESLMASRERRESGAFYTPHALVSQTADRALDEVLSAAGVSESVRLSLLQGEPLGEGEMQSARQVLSEIRVLDPACGSGAFLVFLLERIAEMLRALGDPRPMSTIRRDVVTRSLFGVDINPMAVWLCELRLWLSVILDLDVHDPLEIPPLPNLDRNVRVGDTLAGGAWSPASPPGDVGRLRARYARATGRRKATLARALDIAERAAAISMVDARLTTLSVERRHLVAIARGRDLFGGRRGALGSEQARRDIIRNEVRGLRQQRYLFKHRGALPFAFASHFADVQSRGGFDLVVGNPPWVRLHRIPPQRRTELRQEYRVFRDAAWKRGAESAKAGPGFAAQIDLAALFAERSVQLVRPGGVLALLLPVKLWRSLAGGGVRELLSKGTSLRVLEDWSEAPAAFDAAVYPSLLVAQRHDRDAAPPDSAVRVTVHRKRVAVSWRSRRALLPLDESPGSPWLLLPPDARRAFARVAAAGTPLAECRLGLPTLGVKCGCNDAFLVHPISNDERLATVRSRRGNVRIERALLRPVVRGEAVERWRCALNGTAIVWTHDASGAPLNQLPPAAARWFSKWRHALAKRSDARDSLPWWSLFRTDGAGSSRPRVVWADVSRGPRACVLPAKSPVVPLNSCYVLVCRDDFDAAALAALFNSPLVAGWLDAIAEPARGGFRRFLGWTVARLPIPNDWDRAREILAPLGARGVAGFVVDDVELLEATRDAYRVSQRTVASLLEWTWR